MRFLSLSLLALAFAVGTMASASACPTMNVSKTGTTVADAGQPQAPSTPVQVPSNGG
jgi:hypothetical protein